MHGIRYVFCENNEYDDDVIDTLALDLDLNSNSKNLSGSNKIKIIAIYRPPNSNFETFFDKLNKILNSLKRNHKTFIIGDFNINLLESNSNTVKSFEIYFFLIVFSFWSQDLRA